MDELLFFCACSSLFFFLMWRIEACLLRYWRSEADRYRQLWLEAKEQGDDQDPADWWKEK